VKRINLLPPEQRAKASRERGLLWAILILVAVVVVLGLVYVWENNQVNNKQAELDAISAQVAAEQQKLAALQPYAQIQETRTAMTAAAKGIYDSRVSWSTILQEVSLIIPDNVRLQSLAGVVPATMLPGTAVTLPPGTAAVSPDISFTGTTYTHQDVADFMTRLGLIPQFTNVQLASSTGAQAVSGGTSTVTFTITVSLRPFLTPAPATQLQGAQQ
jgi:Tfp pilus assembly protein PilN